MMSQESKDGEGETREAPTGNLSLEECISFPGKNGTINIPQQIGPKYITFGMALLEDKTGAEVNSFILKHQDDYKAINMEILQKWVAGRGRSPVAWKTLIDVLRGIKQDSLADEMEAVEHSQPKGKEVSSGSGTSSVDTATATQLTPDDLGALKRLLQPVAGHWVAIADQLGMTSHVPTIESTPGNTGPQALLRDLLIRWLNRGQPTLETLCRALKGDIEIIGGAQVARNLEETFQRQRGRVEKVKLIVDEVLPMVDNSPLDEEDLFDVLEQMLPIVSRWNAIGIGLGLHHSQLEIIEKDRSSPTERMKAVVLAWLRRKYNVERFGEPTWRMLVQAVARPVAGNDTALALKIARKHSAQETSAPTSSTPATSTSPVNKAGDRKMRYIYILLAISLVPASLIIAINIQDITPASITSTSDGPAQDIPLSLPILRQFPTKDGFIDILAEIGSDYHRLGVLLLEDKTGSKTIAIERAMHGNLFEVTNAILKLWLQGKGRLPVTWQTLIECLQDVRLDRLAHDIKSTLSGHVQQSPRHYHFPVPKQSLRNLNVIEKGKLPSISELFSLVIPGLKEVKVIETVATKWKKLALELGLKPSVIESIGSTYTDSVQDCESMLLKWLMHQDGTVSWGKLMTALDNIGFNTITQDLEKATGNYWLPGTNVVGLATASIWMTTELEWKEFGFTINVTLGDFDMCNVTIAACTSGEFGIPSSTILVSSVYYIQISKMTSVPATAECELEVLNSHSKNLRFGLAWEGPPYTFDLNAGDLASRKLQRSIHLPKTPLVIAAFHSQVPGTADVMKYFAHVFRQREGPTLWKLIVVVIPRLLAFEQIVKKYYPLYGHRTKLTQFYFEFDTNETEITLIPEDNTSSRRDSEDWMWNPNETVKKQCLLTSPRERFIRIVSGCQKHLSLEGGIATKGNWKIFPLKLNKISKPEIEKFHKGTSYLLPTFEFMMQYSIESDELSQLEHKFLLVGAKPPRNFFRIYLSRDVVCHTILNIQELEAALAQIDEWETLCENLGVPLATLHDLHSMSLPSARKKRRCLEAFLCTGHACWETVVRAVADSYNVKLAGKIANKYGIDNSWIVDYRQGYDYKY